jgi:hypothetical protein
VGTIVNAFKAAADGFKAHADKIKELAKKQKPEARQHLLGMAEAYTKHAEQLLETGRAPK